MDRRGSEDISFDSRRGEETHGEYLDDGKVAGEVCIQPFLLFVLSEKEERRGGG